MGQSGKQSAKHTKARDELNAHVWRTFQDPARIQRALEKAAESARAERDAQTRPIK